MFLPFRNQNHPVRWIDNDSSNQSSLVDIGLFACYPLLEVLTPCAHKDSRRFKAPPPYHKEQMAVLLTPVIPSQMPSISHLSPYSVQERLLRHLFSQLPFPIFPQHLHLHLAGRGRRDTSVLRNILKNLIFSSLFFLGGKLKEVFIFLPKSCYFDKISGLWAAPLERSTPQKIKLLCPVLLDSKNINH